jgi:hypothetical protein
VISIGGMDSAKEMLVSLYGDPILERGLAVLALDGPGQASCTLREIWVRPGDFPIATAAAIDWLEGRPEIDQSRIAVRGIRMGSMWATQAAAHNDRIKACAVAQRSSGKPPQHSKTGSCTWPDTTTSTNSMPQRPTW